MEIPKTICLLLMLIVIGKVHSTIVKLSKNDYSQSENQLNKNLEYPQNLESPRNLGGKIINPTSVCDEETCECKKTDSPDSVPCKKYGVCNVFSGSLKCDEGILLHQQCTNPEGCYVVESIKSGSSFQKCKKSEISYKALKQFFCYLPKSCKDKSCECGSIENTKKEKYEVEKVIPEKKKTIPSGLGGYKTIVTQKKEIKSETKTRTVDIITPKTCLQNQFCVLNIAGKSLRQGEITCAESTMEVDSVCQSEKGCRCQTPSKLFSNFFYEIRCSKGDHCKYMADSGKEKKDKIECVTYLKENEINKSSSSLCRDISSSSYPTSDEICTEDESCIKYAGKFKCVNLLAKNEVCRNKRGCSCALNGQHGSTDPKIKQTCKENQFCNDDGKQVQCVFGIFATEVATEDKNLCKVELESGLYSDPLKCEVGQTCYRKNNEPFCAWNAWNYRREYTSIECKKQGGCDCYSRKDEISETDDDYNTETYYYTDISDEKYVTCPYLTYCSGYADGQPYCIFPNKKLIIRPGQKCFNKLGDCVCSEKGSQKTIDCLLGETCEGKGSNIKCKQESDTCFECIRENQCKPVKLAFLYSFSKNSKYLRIEQINSYEDSCQENLIMSDQTIFDQIRIMINNKDYSYQNSHNK